MNIPLLLRAGLRYQLQHRWQLLLALTGIAMGVAVVLAVDLAKGAAQASLELSSRQLSGSASHRIVAANGKLPEALYTELYTHPGHPPMAPVIQTRVRIDGQPGRMRLIGLDLFAEAAFRTELPQAIRGETDLGAWLSRPNLAALSSSAAARLGVKPGAPLPVSHQGAPHILKVFAISPDAGLGSEDLIVVDIATAQAIAGMQGTLSHIDLILSDQDHDWLSARLPESVRLVDVGQQSRDTAGLSAAFELNLTAMSLLALLVGVFLIFNAISFSIVQRRNLFGRLRAMGVHQRELARLVMWEAAVLAVIGTLLGTLLGYWLGQGLTRIVAATVSALYYQVSADAMQLGPMSLAKAWALGLTGTLVAAWLPARQAATTPALTTLSRAALEQATRRQIPWLGVSGSGLMLLGMIVALLAPGGVIAGFIGLFMLLLGAAMLTPLLLRALQWLLGRLMPTGGHGELGTIWRMTVRDLDRHLSRLGVATAALMVALAAGVGVAVMVDSMRDAVGDWLQDLLTADVYITAAGFDDGATLPAAVVSRAQALDGVAGFSTYRHSRLDTEAGPIIVLATELAARSRNGFTLISSPDPDPWARFDAGDVLISEPLARRLGLTAGETLTLPTAQGNRGFRITAVFRDFASEHGRLFIDRKHYQRLWNDPAISTLALFSKNGRPDELRRIAEQTLSDKYELVFIAPGEIYIESMEVFESTFKITEVLRLLLVLVAFVGVLSALMALQLERRKEYAILRALGLTRRQVSQLILLESVLLGLFASLLAVPTGLALGWILTTTIQLRAFGWSMPFTVDPSVLLWTLVTGAGAALLAGLYPAWRSGHRDPAPQLRED